LIAAPLINWIDDEILRQNRYCLLGDGIEIGSYDNITILVDAVKKEVGDFEKIPFSQLMPKIAKFKFRRR
jgi:hypothetical protein